MHDKVNWENMLAVACVGFLFGVVILFSPPENHLNGLGWAVVAGCTIIIVVVTVRNYLFRRKLRAWRVLR